jgi:hypothetical protein
LPIYIQLQTTVSTKATAPVTSSVGTIIESFSAAIPAGRSRAIVSQPTKVVATGGTVAVKLTTTFGGKSIVRTISVRPIFTFSLEPTRRFEVKNSQYIDRLSEFLGSKASAALTNRVSLFQFPKMSRF